MNSQFERLWKVDTLIAGCSHAFHAVHFNPVQHNLVATSNDKVRLSPSQITIVHAIVKFHMISRWELVCGTFDDLGVACCSMEVCALCRHMGRREVLFPALSNLKNKVGEVHLCMLLGTTVAIVCWASGDVFHQCSTRSRAPLHWHSLTTLATTTPAP